MGVPNATIIQGGMGAGVSNYRLANTVSRAGQLGVVSGTALDLILARRLQAGDPGGDMRRALAKFPLPGVAERIVDRYYIPEGKAGDNSFQAKPVPALRPNGNLAELLVASNFVEVWLAKEGHDGPIGINFLEKIQLPNLASFYGAMLAGVDVVLMGAGIPKFIPGVLDGLAAGRDVELPIPVVDDQSGELARFSPAEFCGGTALPAPRPAFLAIVASAPLATMLARKATGHVDGFVIEGPLAGGHNAPPRGKPRLSETGEPVYGPRDDPDLAVFRDLGRPFWLAGSWGRPGRLAEALAQGATGVQVGTAFAFCEESGIDPEIKRNVLASALRGTIKVRTDPVASPTGFPLKIVQLEGTVSDPGVVKKRTRICDLGYLRHAYRREDGRVGWRCPSEPIKDFVRKGGKVEDTEGRLCVCNGLMRTIGLGQTHDVRGAEPPLVTSGDDVSRIACFVPQGKTSYSAQDVLDALLQPAASPR